MHDATCGQPDEKVCISCNGTSDTAANPLVVLVSEGGQGIEFIHVHCAHKDSRFGFCWCCRESVAYCSEDLNEAGECEKHDGESVPDYPVEDAESYIENIRNNG
ncbi:hypothetical protein PPGU19_004590 [Paraburkholderia sp. PGU19]|uniref:hypothetical protein n=1 Tax=Paraburkholderia sp. PGU19 TaxID=2735434 RepID=UPI0015DB5804|nr:hypothetical protein [Paraburkholderia sp. PGU19]BCF95890.1 hypothetical protein PPGU19_004590 [Paraburkholderia sp. PGU19]